MSVVDDTTTEAETTAEADGGPGLRSRLAGSARTIVLLLLLLVLIFAAERNGQLGRLGRISFVIAIVVAVSAAVFVAANLLVSQARRDWPVYRSLAGVILGATGFGLLRGNRSVGTLVSDGEYRLASEDGTSFVVDDPDLISILSRVADPDLLEFGTGAMGLIEWPILGAILGGIAGYATGLPNRVVRLAVPIGVALFGGWLIADNLLFRNRPDASLVTILVVALIGAAVGALLTTVLTKRRALVERALAGAAVGAVIGGWLMPELATGSAWDARFATIIPLVLVAARFGWPAPRDASGMADFDRRARAVIFLGPALTFLSINLVIPAIRTIYTSFLDRESEDFVGLDNYRDLIDSEAFLDTREWRDPDGSLALFSSQLFWIGAFLVIAGLAASASIHYTRNRALGLERSPGSVGTFLVGIFIFAFAVFSVIRGTFPNTIWWMFTVTIGSTVVGLAMAVLSQRAGRWESFAKSLVFMPMAISMVGASVIFRFQYQPKNISSDQTGVLNALWVELGKLSQSGVEGNPWPAWPRILVLVILGAIIARIGWSIYRAWQDGRSFAGAGAALIIVGYLFVELFRRSLGGFSILDDGSVVAEAVAFREEVRPFNNVYLMFILIWIQTGFAMVILSAAIKAVPEEFLEAARIDGATESDQFFYVVLPQILPTLGVVVTTILVAVAKVFDIVRVSTGGNFGTNVLAHDFVTVAFQFLNRGVGSAIAVVILLIVAPILIFNVYQLQRAE